MSKITITDLEFEHAKQLLKAEYGVRHIEYLTYLPLKIDIQNRFKKTKELYRNIEGSNITTSEIITNKKIYLPQVDEIVSQYEKKEITGFELEEKIAKNIISCGTVLKYIGIEVNLNINKAPELDQE